MKKVMYLYNNLLHDLNLQDLTQIESYKQYAYEDIYIENTKDIKKYYDQTHPEVIIFNLDLDFNKQLDIIESISRTHNPQKIVVLIDNKEFQEMLFNSHIPNRIFYRNVTKDILANTIYALLNEKNLALEEYIE